MLVADDLPGAVRATRCCWSGRASTLALNRLVERDRESLERQTHRTLLAGILDHCWPRAEVALRARALGVPLEGRRLVAVVLRPPTVGCRRRARDRAAPCATWARPRRQPCARPGCWPWSARSTTPASGSCCRCRRRDPVDAAVEALATALRGGWPPAREPVVAVGSTVDGVAATYAGRSSRPPTSRTRAANQPARPFHRLEDVRLRGLVHLLRDDARLQTFVEREIGAAARATTRQHGTDLVALLRAYLGQGRNKSAAADAAHLSRPAFYERLHRIERVLGVDLDDVESCLSLHVALVALDAVRR